MIVIVFMNYAFQQVDVFSKKPCMGNAVAVFLESEGLATETMQIIARWTNLSETTFVSPSSSADYKIRIFTPSMELPFAGHPTLGTAWALRKSGLLSKQHATQECSFGLINIIFEDEQVFFELDKFNAQSLNNDHEIEAALSIKGINTQSIDVGPLWMTTEVAKNNNIGDIQINHKLFIDFMDKNKTDGITIYQIMANADVYVRSFYAENNIVIEDPVCGSGNAAVAAHIMKTGNVNRVGMKYKAKQGSFLKRDGCIAVRLGDTIQIGGFCNTIFHGMANIF